MLGLFAAREALRVSPDPEPKAASPGQVNVQRRGYSLRQRRYQATYRAFFADSIDLGRGGRRIFGDGQSSGCHQLGKAPETSSRERLRKGHALEDATLAYSEE